MAKRISTRLDFSEENILIGISCHKKDYWLAFNLNKRMNTGLERIEDFPVFNEKNEELLKYPIYYFEDKDELISYYLISNYHPEGKLFPDYRTLDYFMLINGRISVSQVDHCLKTIKKITNVLAAYEINISKNKSIGAFLSDLELHMIEYLKKLKLLKPPSGN